MHTASIPVRATGPPDAARRSRVARIAGVAVLAALAACAAVPAGIAWYTSNQILLAGEPPSLREQQVLAAGPDWVRLSDDEQSRQPGTWALQWDSGYGWVGRVLATNEAGVVREFRPTVGRLPVGGWASIRGVARTADPRSLLGLAFADVAFDGPLGSYPAWLLPGTDSTWALFVHGRGANRAEALRSVGALASRGLPGLVITYRNDAGAPRSPDGFSHLGATEWADLEAAARWALAHGARRLVLFGYSMGGQIVMQFLARSELASRVSAVVLESPMLDWNAGLAHRAAELGAPSFALPLGKRLATLRAGLDWAALDRVARTGPFATPVLLFHGDRDRYAPVAASDTFARRHAGNVTLVRYDAGDHVEAWNVDPDRYTRTLADWLGRLGAGGASR